MIPWRVSRVRRVVFACVLLSASLAHAQLGNLAPISGGAGANASGIVPVGTFWRLAGGTDTEATDYAITLSGGVNGFSFVNGATKIFSVDGTNNRIGIGNAAPTVALDVTGSITDSGNTILGDAAGDTVTSNAAAWTFSSDTTVALTGGVNGINFDSNTLSIDALNNRLGLGTATPAAQLDIVGGTIADGVPTFQAFGTFPAVTATTNYGALIDYTTAGADNEGQFALRVNANAGKTLSDNPAGALIVDSRIAATTTAPFTGYTTNGNLGLYNLSFGVNVAANAYNTAVVGRAGNAGGQNFGVRGQATEDQATAANIGVVGVARNEGGGVRIGGYFGLTAVADAIPPPTPTFVNAALIADNSVVAVPIFIARDNGTAVFTIADNGAVTNTQALDQQGAISSSVGSILLSDNVVTTGTLDQQGAISSSVGSILLSDAVTETGTLTLTTAAASISAAGTIAGVGLLDTGTNNTSGTTTANLWTSNFVPTAGTGEKMWQFDAAVTNASDFVMAWSAGGTVGMTYGQTSGSGGAPDLIMAGGTLEMVVASGAGFIKSNASAAQTNLTLQSGCNASGETCVGLYSSANLSGATLDTVLFNTGHNSGSSIVYKVNGAAHHTSTGPAPSSYTAGTCTNETGAGDDYKGSITADCTAGQTAQVTFNRAYAGAPVCVCTPANAAADLVTLGEMFCDASASVLTVTLPTAVTAAKINFICVE